MWPLVKVEPQMQSFVKIQDNFHICEKEENLNKFEPSKMKKKGKSRKISNKDSQFVFKQVKCQQVRWNRDEDLLYINFMKENERMFSTENLRRTGRVFMRLSKQMNGQRSPNQCKSHHQKMQKVTKSGNIRQVITYLENKHSIFPDKYSQQNIKDISTKLDISQNEFEQNIKIFVYPMNKNIEIKMWIRMQNMMAW